MLTAPSGIRFDGGRVESRASLRLYAPAVAFGDTWRILSQACRLVSLGFEVELNPVAVASWQSGPEWGGVRAPGVDHTAYVNCFLSLMDKGDCVRVCPDVQTNCFVEHETFFSGWPARSRWVGGSNVIAYQLDGFHKSAPKNPPTDDPPYFVELVKSYGLRSENVGGWRDIRECAEIIRTCHSFVGIDSGLAQMAYSIGAPTDLVLYGTRRQTVRRWHGTLPRRQVATLRHWAPLPMPAGFGRRTPVISELGLIRGAVAPLARDSAPLLPFLSEFC